MMFEITFETRTHFQWSCEFIFSSYDEAKKFLVSQGFNKVSNGFESDSDSCQKAYITPKKVYKVKNTNIPKNPNKRSCVARNITFHVQKDNEELLRKLKITQ